MKLNYFPETDSLYIDLSEKPSVESQEVSAGVVLDYDAEGNLAGIDIDHASRKLDLKELVTSHIPLQAKAWLTMQANARDYEWSDWAERHGR